MRDLRVGFIGLGSQGGPMARRIVASGFPTTLWARRAESLAPYTGTAAVTAGTPREVGAASDVLCVCVVADADVDSVLRGEAGALAGMERGGVVVVHSTVHPNTIRRLQEDFAHLDVLDAPVSGGGERAAARQLLVMVGGDRDAFERCRPVFETYASSLLHVGPLGSGQLAKLLNNGLFTAHLELAAEVFSLAADHGIDESSLAAVLAGSGRSYAAELVARTGPTLDMMASVAGRLLAKDVDLLAQVLPPASKASIIDVADAALHRMGTGRHTDSSLS